MERKALFLKTLIFILIVLSDYLFDLFNSNHFYSNICPNGYFRIGRMKNCHKWLDCSDYKDMTPLMFLNRGLVKNIYLVKWNDNYLILSNLSDIQYVDDFGHNLQVLKQLSPNPLIIQLIGWCNNDMLFTEYHSFSDTTNLPKILKSQMSKYNNYSVKFNLCINYVKILHFLHNSPIGTRVMCDSNTLEKTLSQYLVTNELTLVLNDLDALPQIIEGKGIKCGSRQLFGYFVAPEQLWPKPYEPFIDDKMREYDHKIDIWKIPEVCDWFLDLGTDSQSIKTINLIKNKLTHIHNECKRIDPQTRPSAEMVLEVYQKLFEKLILQKVN